MWLTYRQQECLARKSFPFFTNMEKSTVSCFCVSVIFIGFFNTIKESSVPFIYSHEFFKFVSIDVFFFVFMLSIKMFKNINFKKVIAVWKFGDYTNTVFAFVLH